METAEQKLSIEITASVAALVDHCCKNSKETARSIIKEHLGISKNEVEQLIWSWEQGLLNKELPKKKSKRGIKKIIEKFIAQGIEVHTENKNIAVPYGKPVDPTLKEDFEKMVEWSYTVTEQPFIKEPKTLF